MKGTYKEELMLVAKKDSIKEDLNYLFPKMCFVRKILHGYSNLQFLSLLESIKKNFQIYRTIIPNLT